MSQKREAGQPDSSFAPVDLVVVLLFVIVIVVVFADLVSFMAIIIENFKILSTGECED